MRVFESRRSHYFFVFIIHSLHIHLNWGSKILKLTWKVGFVLKLTSIVLSAHCAQAAWGNSEIHSNTYTTILKIAYLAVRVECFFDCKTI